MKGKKTYFPAVRVTCREGKYILVSQKNEIFFFSEFVEKKARSPEKKRKWKAQLNHTDYIQEEIRLRFDN